MRARVAASAVLAIGIAGAAGANASAAASAAVQGEPGRAPARSKVVVLATSEGPYAEFGDPAATRTGWVVFHALRDDGREGIWTSAGSAPAVVAESGSAIVDGDSIWHMQRFGRQPTINDTMTCAFTTTFVEGGRAVILCAGTGGEYDFVADSGEAFRDFGDCAAINASRQVLFHATIDPPNHPDRADFDPRSLTDPTLREEPDRIPPPSRMTFDGRKDSFHAGLFMDRVNDIRTVGDTAAGLLELVDGFAFNDAGQVAYRASKRPKCWSLLLDSGGPPVVLAETGAKFSAFGVPAIDSRGRAAFVTMGSLGDSMVCRTHRGGGLPEVIADGEDGFSAFGTNVSIDESGRVAFVGRRKDGREALWLVEKKGEARELLSIGAPLEVASRTTARRTVKHLRIGNRAFAGNDRIAVLAQLEPDVEAVVLLYWGK